MNESNTFSPLDTDSAIGVIGIVASAGGVDAMAQLLANLPADFPVPILLFQHLGRGQSKLVNILKGKSPLAVDWANHGDVLRPASVYVTPPQHSLNAHPDGTISLIKVDERGEAFGLALISFLLRSLSATAIVHWSSS